MDLFEVSSLIGRCMYTLKMMLTSCIHSNLNSSYADNLVFSPSAPIKEPGLQDVGVITNVHWERLPIITQIRQCHTCHTWSAQRIRSWAAASPAVPSALPSTFSITLQIYTERVSCLS